MIAFVTGATGFVGRHLVERLSARGDEVRCLVRASSARGGLAGLPGVTLVEGALDDVGPPREALEGIDVVLHAGGVTRKVASPREEFFRVNEGGTRRLVASAQAAGVRRFVLVSTISAVGPAEGDEPLDEARACRPISDYGASKLAAEQVVREGGVPFTIVRLPGVYGPRDTNLVNLLRLVRRGVRPAGSRRVSFIHVDDVVDALLACAEHPAAEDELFHAAGENLTIGEVGAAIAHALGVRAVPLPIPGVVLRGVGALGEVAARLGRRRRFLDGQKARELAAEWPVSSERIAARLGWRARVAFPEGVAAVSRWYAENGWL